MNSLRSILAMSAVLSIFGGAAMAQVITGTTGAIVVIPAPPSVVAGALVSDTSVFAFLEKQNVLLGSNLSLDAAGVGVLGAPGVVLAGTKVNSFLLHANAASAGTFAYSGTITVTGNILGYLYTDSSLSSSNASLGLAPGTLYNPGGFQGIDLAQSDIVNLNGGRHILAVSWHTNAGIDEIRVITEATASAPEGSSILMLAMGSLPLIYAVRRRIRKA